MMPLRVTSVSKSSLLFLFFHLIIENIHLLNESKYGSIFAFTDVVSIYELERDIICLFTHAL